MTEPRSLLAKAADICGFTDDELALIVGRPKPTISAYRRGVRVEYLTGKERMALIRCVRLWIDQASQGLAELERM